MFLVCHLGFANKNVIFQTSHNNISTFKSLSDDFIYLPSPLKPLYLFIKVGRIIIIHQIQYAGVFRFATVLKSGHGGFDAELPPCILR